MNSRHPPTLILRRKNVKHAGLSVTAGLCALLVAAGSVVLPAHYAAADDGFNGASYLITIENSMGHFASRGVITLHADHTVSVIDSGQGGPTFFFTSQLGSWQPDENGAIVARTLDFDFPPHADVARADYTISFEHNGEQVTGTITLKTFPLRGNPLDGGGMRSAECSFTL
jgi:hypothetical protein